MLYIGKNSSFLTEDMFAEKLSPRAIMEGIHNGYNLVSDNEDGSNYGVLANLPYKVYYFSGMTGQITNVLIFGIDKSTYRTKYGLFLDYVHRQGEPVTELFPMLKTYCWTVPQFEQAFRAGFCSQFYSADKMLMTSQYQGIQLRAGKYTCMEVFNGWLKQFDIPFDLRRYNEEVDNLDMLYLFEQTLQIDLQDIVEDMYRLLKSRGRLVTVTETD